MLLYLFLGLLAWLLLGLLVAMAFGRMVRGRSYGNAPASGERIKAAEKPPAHCTAEMRSPL